MRSCLFVSISLVLGCSQKGQPLSESDVIGAWRGYISSEFGGSSGPSLIAFDEGGACAAIIEDVQTGTTWTHTMTWNISNNQLHLYKGSHLNGIFILKDGRLVATKGKASFTKIAGVPIAVQ